MAHAPGSTRRRWCWVLASCAGAAVAAPPQSLLPPGVDDRSPPLSDVALRVVDGRLVDDASAVVRLRGINLGNWLLLEPWMYGQSLRDEATLLSLLSSRFGAAEADRLINLHRDGWVTPRDLAAIAASGFNAVRVPLHHRVLESAPFTPDEAGFARLGALFDAAEDAGLYVLLDMHAAPGGQSLDGPSGDATQNNLWTDAASQDRFIWVWEQIARRFKNERRFVAYDLLNEPYGDFSTDIRTPLLSIMDRTIEAVRRIDPNRLILVPATLQGLRFYGDPDDRGWVNVGFTEHFYPGVFDGQPATLGTHARFLAAELRDRAAFADAAGVPFVLGEFNPVFDRAGAPETARAWLDAAAALDAHAFIWAHKVYSPSGGVGGNNWYLQTNAQPMPAANFQSASLAAIESLFTGLATGPLSTDTAYRSALIAAQSGDLLPDVPLPPLVAPAADAWPTWTVQDIGAVQTLGGQATGGQSVQNAQPLGADALVLYAGGSDLFGTADSLRLAARAMPPSYVLSTRLDAFEGGRFAQAGVTVRRTSAADSPHVSLVAFGDGRVLVKSRSTFGGGTQQRFLATAGFPMGLALQRSGGAFTAFITDDTGAWQSYALSENPSLGSAPLGGFFALANRDGPLTVAAFDQPTLATPSTLVPGPVLDGAGNRIANPSFESAGAAANVPASWSPLGGSFTREVGWTPTRDGSALAAYRHWEAGDGPSSISQTVSGLTPGRTYEWTVYANRDEVAAGRVLAVSAELRVELTTSAGQWLESVTYAVPDIATGDEWSRLQVRFVAVSSQHRVRLELVPAASGTRDGAVKFDTFVLSEVGP